MKKWKPKEFKSVVTYIPLLSPDIEVLAERTRLNPDKLRVTLHQLYLVRMIQLAALNDKNRYVYDAGWTPLNAEVIKRLVGMNYRRYIDILLKEGILFEKTNDDGGKSYIKGVRSSMFRINPQYLGSDGTRFRKEKVTDYCTLKAVHATKEWFNREYIKLESNMGNIHFKLADMTQEIKFDVKATTHYTSDLISSTDDKNAADYLFELPELFEAINNGEVQWAKTDKFGERLHTHLTGVKKDMRKFMRFRELPDDPLLCLDICNSQPYFSSICIIPNVIKQLLPEFLPCVGLVDDIENKDDYIMFSKLCAQGMIYDFWQQQRKITRDEAKAEIIQKVMFAKNKTYSDSDRNIRLAFSKVFPSVSELFYRIKRVDETKLPFIQEIYLKDNSVFAGRAALHKNLSCMMQRIESRVILKRISPKLLDAGVKPFLTIHDSFIIDPKHEQVVRTIIDNEFKVLCVEPPKVKDTLLK